MKRFYIILALVLCAVLAVCAQAEEVAPGDTVKVPVSISTTSAHQITILISFDTNVFDFVSISCDGPGGQAGYSRATQTGRMAMFDINKPISSGRIGFVTLTVKENVKSGTYAVSAAVIEAWDLEENAVEAIVSAGSVTVIAACDHEATEEIVIKEADCESDGAKQIVCNDCGETVKEETIRKLGHDIGEWTVKKIATCTEKGEENAVCARCGEIRIRLTDMLGHEIASWKEVKQATCTEKGEENAVCTRCGETIVQIKNELGHDTNGWMETVKATCTENGEEKIECRRCGETEQRAVPAYGHDFGAWIEETKASCTVIGKEYRVCARCNERENREGFAPGHNEIWRILIPATREKEGLKQKFCKRCNEVLEEMVIPVRAYTNKTASTLGLRVDKIASVIDSNDAWKMLTPIDVTIQGTTRYPLIAGNVYEIGYVEVTVDGETMNVDLVIEAKVSVDTTALVLLTNTEEFKRFSVNDYEFYEFPASISLSDLPADQLLMMVISNLTINQTGPEPKYYNPKNTENKALLENLNEIYKQYFEEKK